MTAQTRDESMAMVPYQVADSVQKYGMLRPLAAPAEAREAIAAYENLKRAIVRPDDVQRIQGRDFLKKAFWRRVATCFGLSLELVSEDRGFDEAGKLFYSVLYRAVAPNGRTMIGDGYCGTAEPGRGGWPEHNVRATAHTRAKNRAISDLVGGGEVSAEEMPEADDEPRRTQPRQPAQTRAAATTPARRTLAQPAPVEVEPRMTFVEAAQADADAVSDVGTPADEPAPRTVPLLFEAWKDAGLPPGEFAPHARKSGGDVDKLIASVWPRIQAARAGAASDYNLAEMPMAAHGSH